MDALTKKALTKLIALVDELASETTHLEDVDSEAIASIRRGLAGLQRDVSDAETTGGGV